MSSPASPPMLAAPPPWVWLTILVFQSGTFEGDGSLNPGGGIPEPLSDLYNNLVPGTLVLAARPGGLGPGRPRVDLSDADMLSITATAVLAAVAATAGAGGWADYGAVVAERPVPAEVLPLVPRNRGPVVFFAFCLRMSDLALAQAGPQEEFAARLRRGPAEEASGSPGKRWTPSELQALLPEPMAALVAALRETAPSPLPLSYFVWDGRKTTADRARHYAARARLAARTRRHDAARAELIETTARIRAQTQETLAVLRASAPAPPGFEQRYGPLVDLGDDLMSFSSESGDVEMGDEHGA